jgi:hypothetical protein
VTHHSAATVGVLLLLLAPAGQAAGCGITVQLQTQDGQARALADGSTTVVQQWSLATLVLTLPITECFALRVAVTVDGRPWDNRVVQLLQPMGPLTFAEDPEAFALVAPAMFRITDTQEHSIAVVYGDETSAALTTYTYRFRAG